MIDIFFDIFKFSINLFKNNLYKKYLKFYCIDFLINF